MKNMKLGFQSRIGFYLGKTLLTIPYGMLDPGVKRQWICIKRNASKITQNIKSEAKQSEPEDPLTDASPPQCKNKIGFTVE